MNAVRRFVPIVLAAAVFAAAVVAASPAPCVAAEPPAAATAPGWTIERVEFEGLARMRPATAARIAALSPGSRAGLADIEDGAERLRATGLFATVEPRTRAGGEPGAVVLVYEVVEVNPHLRFGLGHEDFASWYLVPVQLAADNLTGRGEALRLSARFGYRVAGADLVLRSTTDLARRDYWQLRLFGEGVDRIYWLDSTETRHHLRRSGATFEFGRPLTRSLALQAWLGVDGTQPDSNASVYSDRASLGREKGDEVAFADLPHEIRRDVGEREQARLGLALVRDRRRGAGLATHGTWARLAAEGAFSERGDFGSWQADLRGYAPVGPHAQLAARVRAGAVSSGAPFYERFAVGGLYTARGYPSQSLSPPQGTLNFGAASLELRHAWAGEATNPRFTAIAFVDAAAGWNRERPALADAAASIGAGFRLRLPWFGQAGVDVGRPLSSSPVDEAFHVHGCLGWTF